MIPSDRHPFEFIGTVIILLGMSNRDSIRDDRPRDRLHAMDPDQARYHCEKLRALADLLLAGEAVLWVESSSGDRDRVTVELAAGRLAKAHLGVRRRVAEGDRD